MVRQILPRIVSFRIEASKCPKCAKKWRPQRYINYVSPIRARNFNTSVLFLIPLAQPHVSKLHGNVFCLNFRKIGYPALVSNCSRVGVSAPVGGRFDGSSFLIALDHIENVNKKTKTSARAWSFRLGHGQLGLGRVDLARAWWDF